MTFAMRLAAIDLDGTLLGPDKRISAENVAAVHRLRIAGLQILLASGRRHDNMLRFHRHLDLSGPIISCNGALVKDAETGEVLFQRLLPVGIAAAIVREGDRLGITQNYYHTDGDVYVREKTGWTRLYEGRTEGTVTPVGDLQQFGGECALKIIWIDDPVRSAARWAALAERYPELYITTTDPEYMEFMAHGVSKAAGAAIVADRMGVSPAQVVAFGDGNNDIPMLEWAGVGVAMADASAPVRAAADWTAPPGDPETSVARAVRALLDGEMA